LDAALNNAQCGRQPTGAAHGLGCGRVQPHPWLRQLAAVALWLWVHACLVLLLCSHADSRGSALQACRGPELPPADWGRQVLKGFACSHSVRIATSSSETNQRWCTRLPRATAATRSWAPQPLPASARERRRSDPPAQQAARQTAQQTSQQITHVPEHHTRRLPHPTGQPPPPSKCLQPRGGAPRDEATTGPHPCRASPWAALAARGVRSVQVARRVVPLVELLHHHLLPVHQAARPAVRAAGLAPVVPASTRPSGRNSGTRRRACAIGCRHIRIVQARFWSPGFAGGPPERVRKVQVS
jgi:hypothetical protein